MKFRTLSVSVLHCLPLMQAASDFSVFRGPDEHTPNTHLPQFYTSWKIVVPCSLELKGTLATFLDTNKKKHTHKNSGAAKEWKRWVRTRHCQGDTQRQVTPMASSVTHSQWPMSIEREAARAAQVCITRALVNALWSRALSTRVSSRCCFDLSRAAFPAAAAFLHLKIRLPQGSGCAPEGLGRQSFCSTHGCFCSGLRKLHPEISQETGKNTTAACTE